MLETTSAVPEAQVSDRTVAARETSRRNAATRQGIREELRCLHPRPVLAGHLERRTAELEGLYTSNVLRWLPSMGPRRADKLLASIGVDLDRRVRDLSEAERALLVHELRKGSR